MIALQLEECTAPGGSNNSPAELLTAIRIALAYDSTTTSLRTRVSLVRVRVRDDSSRTRTRIQLPKYLETVEVEAYTGVRS